MAGDVETKKKKLFTSAMKGKWDDVINLYKEDPRLHTAKITRSGSTALHVAVFDGNEEVVEQMVRHAESCPEHCKEALETQNSRKNTVLHVAASMGNLRMCQLIAQRHPNLISVRNVDGETPLFLAALHGRKEAFLCLHHLSPPNGSCSSPRANYDNCRRNGGDTILHCAIAGNFNDLAFQIIHLYGELVNWVNEEGLSPLHLLAAKPSDFKSGSLLGRYERIVYHCMYVEELKVPEYHYQESFSEADRHKTSCNLPENYRTCCDIFRVVKKSLVVVTSKFPVANFLIKKFCSKGRPSNAEDPAVGKNSVTVTKSPSNAEDPEEPTNNNSPGSECRAHGHPRQLYPENYEPCCKFFRFVYLALTVILGQGSSGLKRIRRKKEKHVWSLQIMNELLRRTSLYEYENDGSEPQALEFGYAADTNHAMDEIVSSYSLDQDSKITRPGNEKQQQDKGGKDSKKKRTETVILIAAKNGVTEMVEKIIELFPVAIHDMNEEKKNVVLLAVEHRQPHVYKLLLRRNILKESAFRQVDHKGNSALHLAAKFGQYKPWLIPGAALQMQWEIKWFEFVKESMPSHLFARRNKHNKTPKDIFMQTHSRLVESGGQWLNKTSESCSVVAALIATVAFATSATLPGGVDQNTGRPTLEKEPAFNVFAISSLIALCCSITAVVMFLSILTSRYQEYDFKAELPMKLIVGLTSLFMSIASMLVSFCAGHFFVLRDQLKYAALPIYAVTCLPVTLFALAQFPLYFDLVWATFKSVPQRSYKAIPSKFSAEDSTLNGDTKKEILSCHHLLQRLIKFRTVEIEDSL